MLFHNLCPTNWRSYQFQEISFKHTVNSTNSSIPFNSMYYLHKDQFLSNQSYRRALFRWATLLVRPGHDPSTTSAPISDREALSPLERVGRKL